MGNFSSKIFIDGGEPEETAQAKKLLGFLDGQTTNPTLIAKNLLIKIQNPKSPPSPRLRRASKIQIKSKIQYPKLSKDKALEEYKRIVREMSAIIPKGSISIQVFANPDTKAEEMLEQARQRRSWIPNSSIKFPCTSQGLKAAQIACREMPINITLVFSQAQAAAVYEATKQARFPVFISPFVGRLDDRGENGMQVVANILKMYQKGDGHVEVLTASVRNLDHLLYALQLKSDIITIPFKVFQVWSDAHFRQPEANYLYHVPQLKPITYQDDIVLGRSWSTYDLHHDLTDKGISAFWLDWMGLFR